MGQILNLVFTGPLQPRAGPLADLAGWELGFLLTSLKTATPLWLPKPTAFNPIFLNEASLLWRTFHLLFCRCPLSNQIIFHRPPPTPLAIVSPQLHILWNERKWCNQERDRGKVAGGHARGKRKVSGEPGAVRACPGSPVPLGACPSFTFSYTGPPHPSSAFPTPGRRLQKMIEAEVNS